MKVYYIGHSAFYVEIRDKKFLFDPWISGNPMAVVDFDIKPDYIFVSHGHFDHGFEDSIRISKESNSKLVGVFELVKKANVTNALPGNIGGLIKDGDVEIYITPALHSCPYGVPAGFIVKYGGNVIYHAGDTALFSDMQLLSKLYSIDLALLPIGGVYTMSPREAQIAVDFLKPKYVIPMHYNTFPAISQDPGEFEKSIENSNVIVLSPGKSIEI